MNNLITKGSFLIGGVILGVSLQKYVNSFKILVADGTTGLPVPFPNYKLPSNDDIKIFQNFIVSYNRRTRNPNWVLEWLTPSLIGNPSDKAEFRKDLSFEYDETEPLLFRILPSDYNGSGYDRGHLAAAANYKNNELDCRRSFIMTNICPQVGENFNRGIWNKLEMFTRALVRKSDYVFVCTGPLYLPLTEGTKKFVKYEVIGKNDVAVPTHFFKVLLIKERGLDSFKLFSYVLPNKPIKDTEDFRMFHCHLADIEKAAGFFIFSQLMHTLQFSQVNDLRIN